jgi:hypothetical protein
MFLKIKIKIKKQVILSTLVMVLKFWSLPEYLTQKKKNNKFIEYLLERLA